jgi:hypothetical protein
MNTCPATSNLYNRKVGCKSSARNCLMHLRRYSYIKPNINLDRKELTGK